MSQENNSQDRITEFQNVKALLAKVGLCLYGYNPGVTAVDKKDNCLSFGYDEWDWLKPLLEELLELRKKETAVTINFEEISAIQDVVSEMFEVESVHYLESGEPNNHIFLQYKVLENFLWKQKNPADES